MTIRPREFSEMVGDSVEFLTENTKITFLEQGSIARALIDAPLLELVKLQDFVVTNFDNSFLSAAAGPFLDLFGDSLGLPRRKEFNATVFKEDGAIRFFVRVGTLGQALPDPDDPTKGLIPKGTLVQTADGTIQFSVFRDITFPLNVRSTFVDAIALEPGKSSNVGPNQLSVHTLNNTKVFVTNDLSISTGEDDELDDDYRFRLSQAFSTRFSGSQAAVQVAASSVRGVVRAEILPFARGAGTFDVLLIPKGNRLTQTTIAEAERAINSVIAFGISPKIRQPTYIPIQIIIRLRYEKGTEEGIKGTIKDSVQSSILNYIGSISLGGEFVINQLRAAVLSVSDQIIDLSVLELCIDDKPRAIRNHQLANDELFIPDENKEAVIVV